MKAYQYIIRDNQVMGVPSYKLTPEHYSSRGECEKEWGAENTEDCFSVIRPLRESKANGAIAWMLTEHERKRAKYVQEVLP